ncbi:MAG: NADH-quinone oxidoreductase subunit N [Phycisphaerales bacterium]|nr:NADH-quinone oxidoreductase subunit N [Phycisphaerales bacterium]
MNYLDVLILAAPETIVAIAGLVAVGLDLAWLRLQPRKVRMRWGALITTIGCAAAIAWLWQTFPHRALRHSEDMLVLTSLTHLIKMVVLALSVFTAWISTDADFTDHVGEYFSLLLFATVGMMFLVSSENLLMIFISLELLSLGLYTMTAFNKQNARSAEAALKYFLFGGMSAAFLLFGLSLVYGLTGEITLSKTAAKLASATPQGVLPLLGERAGVRAELGKVDPLLIVALILVMVGFGFKVAAVPFHLWAPDAYQGAPTPTAAFIASGSKVASFFILAKVLFLGFSSVGGSAAWRAFVDGWLPIVAILAALSIALGNLAAIAQTSVRRLLAYSAVAHAGYALLAVLAVGKSGLASLIYYVITYACTVLGAFGVVAVVQERAQCPYGISDRFGVFAGLNKRAPLLSFCMLIFMLSLAGIPPLAGFFGKFYIFAAALSSGKNLGLLWLVIFAIAMSAVSLYYYLQVLKQIYVAPVESNANTTALPPLRSSIPARLGIVLLAVAVVVLGVSPNLLLGKLLPMIELSGIVSK